MTTGYCILTLRISKNCTTSKLAKAQKLAYKLSHKVLHPQSIDKTNVKLSGSVFHESTANGLDYYAETGYLHFKDTAEFVNIVKNSFNCVNVKTPDYGIRKRDTILEPVHQNNKKGNLPFCNLTQNGSQGGMSTIVR